MASVAPRIVSDASYVKRIRQAGYLVKLEDDPCCFAHCTGHVILDADQS